jgi:hypothetical protein
VENFFGEMCEKVEKSDLSKVTKFRCFRKNRGRICRIFEKSKGRSPLKICNFFRAMLQKNAVTLFTNGAQSRII